MRKKKDPWEDRYLCIYCQVEGVPESKKMVQFKPKNLAWEKFILILQEQMEMEEIEGVYILEGGLQVWRVDAIVNEGEDSEYFIRFSESAALLRGLAAEGKLSESAPEAASCSWSEVKRAANAKEHLQEELDEGWPEMSPYTG